MQNRHGAKSLRRHLPIGHHNGQLATARNNHAAGHEHVVTQVNQGLPLRQGLSSTSASESIAWMRLPSVPPCRVAKHSLPVLRTNTTRPPVHHALGLVACLQLAGPSFGSYSARKSSMVGLHAVTLRSSPDPPGMPRDPTLISFARFPGESASAQTYQQSPVRQCAPVLTVIPICVVCWGLF